MEGVNYKRQDTTQLKVIHALEQLSIMIISGEGGKGKTIKASQTL